MTELKELFVRSVGEFDSRVKQIKDDQWELPTPCSDWNVRDLVNHLVYEDLWAPPLLEGQTVEQVGDRFEGDVLGEAPVAAWDKASSQTLDAAGQEGALERQVHLSRGPTPAAQYVGELLNDHVIHAWDLARAIGADDNLDQELVEFLYELAKPMEDTLKATGAYGDKVEAPEDADTQTKLLAVMGRRA